MNSSEATREFVYLMRVGSAALQNVLKSDERLSEDVEPEFRQILILLDSLDDASHRLQKKAAAPSSRFA